MGGFVRSTGVLLATEDGIGRLETGGQVALLDTDFEDLDSAVKAEEVAGLLDASFRGRAAFDELRYAPPVRPGRFVIIGFNYPRHATETHEFRKDSSQHGYEIPSELVFTVADGARPLSAHDEPIPLPRGHEHQVDYEGEMAVVIGRCAAQVKAAEAWKYVAGICPLNDVSARDVQFAALAANDLGPTQADAKSFPGFKPIGPGLLVLGSEGVLTEHLDLSLTTRVNGELRQDARTSEMLWSVPQLIAELTALMPLEPGDVICTGSPDGVGFVSGKYLSQGDVIEIELEGLPVLRNHVVGPAE